jgi:hypothetical protein
LEDRTLPSFLAPVSYPVGGVGPRAVAVGDFTGTGIPDLVVANHDSGTVSVLLGKGDGTFGPAKNFAVGGTPVSVAVGDFNNDGKLDIVTANDKNSTVSVLLGKGDGTFQPALNFVLPLDFHGMSQIPQSLAVGDFNKDGKLDVAVTAYTTFIGNYGSYDTGYANVLIGNGAGGFTTNYCYPLDEYGVFYNFPGGFTSSVAVGDFRANGNLDLAVTEYDAHGLGGASNLTVLLGNGDGTFGLSTDVFTGFALSSAVGDFNGDHKLDLVTGNTDSVSVLLGYGNGTFGPPVNSTTPGSANSVAVADFNRDGKLDLAVSGSYGVSALMGRGDGTFADVWNYAATSYAGLAVGDFNRDGWPDLAAVNPSANTVSVFLNGADWSTSLPPLPASSIAVSGFPSTITAGASGSFTVTAKYADGTTDTHYTSTVHFTSSDSQAILPADYTFTAADAGVHTFSATLKTSGTQSITATDKTSASLTAADTGITVNPAAAGKFIITAPASITSGLAFSLTVKVEDAYGNVVTGYTGTVHFSSTDGSATLPADYKFTAADAGVHTFTGLVLHSTGNQTITIADVLNSALTDSVIVDVLKKKK